MKYNNWYSGCCWHSKRVAECCRCLRTRMDHCLDARKWDVCCRSCAADIFSQEWSSGTGLCQWSLWQKNAQDLLCCRNWVWLGCINWNSSCRPEYCELLIVIFSWWSLVGCSTVDIWSEIYHCLHCPLWNKFWGDERSWKGWIQTFQYNTNSF